jgi:muramoyltetrapeptide carboxypeptidase
MYTNASPIKLLGFIFLIAALFGCSSCSHFYKTKEPKLEFNRVVYDPEFQQRVAAHPIKLVAPASGTDPKRVEKLRSLPYLDIPENLMEHAIVYHSTTDKERLAFLKKALYDSPNHSVVWSLRGGYGSARLIDELKKLPKPKHEKIFIGYSDITALHLFLAQEWNWKPVHGAVLNELLIPSRDPQNFQRLASLIAARTNKNSSSTMKNPSAKIWIDQLKPLNSEARKLKKVSGLLTGGNITMIETSLGTDWQIQSQDKILFLEDVNMEGYQLDRALYHLKQAGVFKNVRAIVFGDLIKYPEEINFALDRFAAEIQIPVFKTNQFGHGTQNFPLVYHAESAIVKQPKGDSVQELQEQEYSLMMKL